MSMKLNMARNCRKKFNRGSNANYGAGEEKILIVEDEPSIARDIQRTVKAMSHDIPVIAQSGEEAIQLAEEIKPHLVLVDMTLQGEMDGIEAAKQIRDRFFDVPIVYLTFSVDDQTVERANVTEPFGYLLKPLDERELRSTIEIALYKHTF